MAAASKIIFMQGVQNATAIVLDVFYKNNHYIQNGRNDDGRLLFRIMDITVPHTKLGELDVDP